MFETEFTESSSKSTVTTIRRNVAPRVTLRALLEDENGLEIAQPSEARQVIFRELREEE